MKKQNINHLFLRLKQLQTGQMKKLQIINLQVVGLIHEYVYEYEWKSHIYNKDTKYKQKWINSKKAQLLLTARFYQDKLAAKINDCKDAAIGKNITITNEFEQSKIDSDQKFVEEYHKLFPELAKKNIDYISDTAYIIMDQAIPLEIYGNILYMPSNISYVNMKGSRGYSPFTTRISSNKWTSTKLDTPCRLCLTTQVTNCGVAQYCTNCQTYLCTHKNCKVRLKNNIKQVIISERYLWRIY